MSRRRRTRWRRPAGETPQESLSPESARRSGRGGIRPKTIAFLAVVAIIVTAAIVSGLVLLLRPGDSRPKALIVDQLGATIPNQEFINTTVTTLLDAGYDVHYAPGEKVTVDFYSEMGGRGYDLIILRAHVARLGDRVTKELGDDAIIFTSEPYTETKYVKDQQAGHLAFAHTYAGGQLYFGLPPAFIKAAIKGSFDGATIIIMGCDALRSDAAAQAFVDKGAKAVIGWAGPVTASHTDAATEKLIQHLIADRESTAQAVAQTMEEVGPDPAYPDGGPLRVYPQEADFVLP